MAGVSLGLVLVFSLAATPFRRRSGIPLLVFGSSIAVVANLPLLAQRLPISLRFDSRWLELLTHPIAAVVTNSAAVLLIGWGIFRLVANPSVEHRMARRLERRGDRLGAAELYRKAGSHRRALALFQGARAWAKAADVALELGRDREAAGLLRRAGGRKLVDASRLYRRSGDNEAARRCDHDLAEWYMGQGRFDEAVEAWMSAGEPRRAVRAAGIALSEGRLQPSHPAFRIARRAAEEARDLQLLARLHEVEGSWAEAAHVWKTAGEHTKAAENFRRASQLDEAAREEAAAGRPRESARLRIQHLGRLQERLHVIQAKGSGESTGVQRLRQQIVHTTDSLLPQLVQLGMEDEFVHLLSSTGRVDEAIRRLVDLGEDNAAAELAHESQRWELAAPILEKVGRWGEASDVYELAGDLDRAARCAERAGEDERALQLYRKLGKATETAHCMARLGYLQDALVELHRAELLGDASQLLRNHPGPVPDIPDVILDLANWIRKHGTLNEAIACLQRAVLGVAMKAGRLDPAVALARLLHEAGDERAAFTQLERVLSFDYAFEPAQKLKHELTAERNITNLASTRPVRDDSAEVATPGTSVEQRYEIQTELGRGGMGVVFQARDNRLERDVAIKVLRTTSPEEAARLEREAKAAATLNHPGIVTIFDFEAGFGGYFIVMEYVPGEPLDQLVRSQPDRLRAQLLPLLVRLADAVAYAHDHHVIHRDLKPGNILLTPDHDVKILDFGIAARLDTEGPKEAGVCGTPFYMAPEQIRGEIPTPATDLYAFGATAFHLATGRPPFNRGDVIGAHLNKEPPNPLELVPQLVPALGNIILRCLAKQPASRFSSAADLRDALRSLTPPDVMPPPLPH